MLLCRRCPVCHFSPWVARSETPLRPRLSDSCMWSSLFMSRYLFDASKRHSNGWSGEPNIPASLVVGDIFCQGLEVVYLFII